MDDIVCFNNRSVYITRGSKLRDVIAVVSKNVKENQMISTIDRIPNPKTGVVIWEIKLTTRKKV